jgi:putative glycosyltransferase (TIGR04372 family)
MPCKLKLFVLLPFSAALVLAMVVASPIRRIRLGPIGSARIGHFITTVEAYLCKTQAGILATTSGCIDVFYFEEQVCNEEIARQWRGLVLVFPFPRVAFLAARLLAKCGPLGRRHLILADELSIWGVANERAIHRYRGHLVVPADIVRAGDEFLAMTAKGKPLVCLHVRDSAYLRQTQPDFDYSYHDYRDWHAGTLADAAAELSQQGYFLVRMGAVVDGTLPFLGVFDYARSGLRSAGMDLYLASRCAFWIGTASGLVDLPWAFQRPLVIVNHVAPLLPTEPRITFYKNSLWTFKKFWSEQKGRLLTFREILNSGVGSLSTGPQFKAAGVRFEDNSSEEIRDVTQEMVGRLNGTWVTTAEDEDLQSRFWALWGASMQDRARAANARIGARFLSKNRELLT